MKKVLIISVLILSLASCITKRNACNYCIEQNKDIIKSDTVLQGKKVSLNVELKGSQILKLIDCESLNNTIVIDETGLSLEMTKQEDGKIAVIATQQDRISTIDTVISVPVTVQYHADIARFGIIKDSLQSIISDLQDTNKRLERRKCVKKGLIWRFFNHWIWFVGFWIIVFFLVFVIRKLR